VVSPLIGAVIAAFKLPESPRWLASKGRIVEAEATVRAMEEERTVAAPVLSIETSAHRHRADPLSRVVSRHLLAPDVRRLEHDLQLVLHRERISRLGADALHEDRRLAGPARAIMLQIVNVALVLVLTYAMAFTVDSVGRVRWFVIGFGISALGAVLGVIVTGPTGHPYVAGAPRLRSHRADRRDGRLHDDRSVSARDVSHAHARLGKSAGQASTGPRRSSRPVLIGWIMAETGADHAGLRGVSGGRALRADRDRGVGRGNETPHAGRNLPLTTAMQITPGSLEDYATAILVAAGSNEAEAREVAQHWSMRT